MISAASWHSSVLAQLRLGTAASWHSCVLAQLQPVHCPGTAVIGAAVACTGRWHRSLPLAVHRTSGARSSAWRCSMECCTCRSVEASARCAGRQCFSITLTSFRRHCSGIVIAFISAGEVLVFLTMCARTMISLEWGKNEYKNNKLQQTFGRTEFRTKSAPSCTVCSDQSVLTPTPTPCLLCMQIFCFDSSCSPQAFFSLSFAPHPLFFFFLSLFCYCCPSDLYCILLYLYLVILWFFASKGWNVSHLVDLILHQFPARFSQCKKGGKPFSHLNKLHCQLIFLQPPNDIFCTQVTGDSVTFQQFLSEGKDVKKMILI